MTQITRHNIDALLDAGRLEVAMSDGRWWRLRRNGRTQTWKRNPERIRIPFKFGLRGCDAITEWDFTGPNFTNSYIRVKQDG